MNPGIAPRDTDYFPTFDWLRFVLACLVMFSHYGLLPIWPKAGNFAVQVFFALSGWLIGGILLGSTRADMPRFYFNRAVRIWVPYYLALVFLVAASLLRDPVTAKWLEFVAYKSTFVWNLFGTQQLATAVQAMPLKGTGNHFWSVNAEEQFYLLAPWLLVFASPRLGRHPLTWILLALMALVFELYGAIVLGVLAAVVQQRHPDFQLRPAIRGVLLALLIGTATLLALDLGYEYVTPLCSIVIVLLLAVRGSKTALGSLAGGLSYQLYLNHWIGGMAATVLMTPLGLRNSPIHMALGVVLSLGLAAGLYWWIDRPLLARRGQSYSRRRGLMATAIGYGLVVAGIAFGLALKSAG